LIEKGDRHGSRYFIVDVGSAYSDNYSIGTVLPTLTIVGRKTAKQYWLSNIQKLELE
jgi:hypothetical protein